MARVIHFEIHASNPTETISFYKNLFGWEDSQWPGIVDYWLLKTGAPESAGIDGGLLIRRGEPPMDGQSVNAYVCTLEVDDLDGVLDRAIPLGGRIAVEKMPVPHVGYVAYLKDPAGNIFGIMQPDPSAGIE